MSYEPRAKISRGEIIAANLFLPAFIHQSEPSEAELRAEG